MNRTYAYKRVLEIVSTRACVCLFPTCGIQHLPVELVVNILSELDASEIALWQRVSKHFRDIVADSVTLQYKIECCIADVLEEPPNPMRNKQEQLDAIRAWRRRWDTGDLKMVVRDGELAESVTRAVVKRDHGFQDLPEVLGHAYDADRGLLVTARFSDTHGSRVRLDAVNIATGQVYAPSDKQISFVIPVLPGDPDADQLLMDIQGTRVVTQGVYSREAGNVGIGDSVEHYWLHDLQSGDQLLKFWTDPLASSTMTSHAFFDEVCMVMTITDDKRSILAVFDCYKDKVINSSRLLSVKDLLNAALLLFLLPEPRGIVSCYNTHYQAPRKSLPSNLSDSKFTPANSSPVMHVSFSATDQELETSKTYQLLIPFSTIDTLISQHMPFSDVQGRLKPPRIAWKDWGDETRLFEDSNGDICVVSGTRYVTKEHDPVTGQRVVVIYDFCVPPKMLHDLARDPDGVEIDVDCSVVADPRYFVDPEIDTMAPYRRIKTDIVLADREEPTLTEDAIVLVDKSTFPAFPTRIFCI